MYTDGRPSTQPDCSPSREDYVVWEIRYVSKPKRRPYNLKGNPSEEQERGLKKKRQHAGCPVFDKDAVTMPFRSASPPQRSGHKVRRDTVAILPHKALENGDASVRLSLSSRVGGDVRKTELKEGYDEAQSVHEIRATHEKQLRKWRDRSSPFFRYLSSAPPRLLQVSKAPVWTVETSSPTLVPAGLCSGNQI